MRASRPSRSTELLAAYDVWDRYDYDNDGDFNEPDGYIDHFQAVHAGMGEEVGGGALGSAAIWSHRWFASYNLAGLAGPSFNRQGGVRVGNSRYWVGDYTIEPENGGVGVFAHEFAHDLDIPDLYNTTGAADNSVGFWSLMASGSYGSDGTVDIGSKPTHMGAWEKLMLGWLDYEVAVAGRKSGHKLEPSTTTTKQAQAIVVVLPDLQVGPFEGSRFFYSGSGPNLNTMMLKSVTLPVGATLAAKVRYDIEQNWDYAYLVVYDGATYHRISTNRSTTTNPNGQNAGNGITGSTDFEWVDLTADLSAFGGQTVQVGFLYRTDAFVNGLGFSVDALAISGQPVDGAESGTGWAFTPDGNGFRIVTGSLGDFFNAYIAELRQYRGYDESLETGPYVFGFLNDPSLQDYVAHFPYQTGLLVSYYDSRYSDNNVSAHPGRGLILPIDAHPEPLLLSPTTVWAARYQSYDSPFGLQRTDPITLYRNGAAYSYSSLPAVPIFDDREPRWDPAVRFAGVRTPATGTRIRVKSISAQGSFMQVEVAPAK